MEPCDLTQEPPKCTFSDLYGPAPKAPSKGPVYLQLHKLLRENVGTVVSTGGQPFAYIPNVFGSFNVPVRSSFLRNWLIEHHLAKGNPLPAADQLNEALHAFASKATAGSSSGVPRRMNVRTAWDSMHREPLPITDNRGDVVGFNHFTGDAQPAIVFSLDTYRGRHVAITAQGWSVRYTSSEFVYDPVQQTLPEPEPAGPDPEPALAAFQKLLRLDDETWKTLLTWILTAMRPARNEAFHDYPILNLVGPANSGKTVAAKLLAQLLDPSGIPINSLPATERRLHVLAAAQHILAFDSPGKINPEKSRILSRLSTGVGSAYRDYKGMLVRPIILTTRNHAETRHLTTRIVDVPLAPISSPLSQQEIWEEFEKQRPQILAALFTLLSRDFDAPPTQLQNRKTKKQKIEESIPLLLQKHEGRWQGTVTDLQQALDFPVTVNALGRYLKQTTTVQVTSKKNDRTVIVTLSFV